MSSGDELEKRQTDLMWIVLRQFPGWSEIAPGREEPRELKLRNSIQIDQD